ncbi:MAG TPA: hypothetical protein VN726_05010 [Hanamia sp.]|nr:hypothetical protein [Hanamia sp.]
MKTKKLLFIAAAFAISFICQNAQAKIWRVNNTSNYNGTTLWGDNLGGTSTNPVFTQLSDANTSNLVDVNGIDTIHVEGTNIVYNAVTFNRKLIVIGTGYFLNENPNVSNTVSEAQLQYVVYNTGSEGSQLIGLHVGSSPYGISVNVSNILIKRCRIDYNISVTYNISDVFVLQNHFTNTANNTSSAILCSPYGFPTNFIFDNNICKKTLLLSTSATNIYNAEECNNNVFDCPAISGSASIQMNVSSFKNNILKTSSATVNINVNVASSNVSNNVSASATNQFGTTNNNIVITDMSTLFVDPATNTTDGRYQLKPGSAAGADGTDRGAFGGLAVSNRYTLSGLAAIPVIYNINTSGVSGSGGLNVSIKARTIK